MLPFVYKSALLERHRVPHAFFSRIGGVSTETEFASLNCHYGSTDSKDNIQRNFSIAAHFLGFSDVYELNQTHSDIVVEAEDPREKPEGDAIFTADHNKLVSIKTSDCVPILLYSPITRTVVAVHVGWRGAIGGIIQNAVAHIAGGDAGAIIAAIGPCIQAVNYEVDDKFYQQFVDIDPHYDRFFYRNDHGKWHCNLPDCCSYLLRNCNIDMVDNLGVDTYGNPQHFYSYRRYTHLCQQNGHAVDRDRIGRQLSAIALPRLEK